jgi:methylmalonyl-CoA/ethylmalonyl-CoA epimerase
MTLDHVGVAVRTIGEALPFYTGALGLSLVHSEEIIEQNVRVAFLKAGQSSIELLEPLSNEGAIAKFIEQKGPGLHHIAFRVPIIEPEMKRLSDLKAPPLEPSPRIGAHGRRVCFIHPRFCHGSLIEIVEASDA